MHLAAGERIAVVGPNGAGKSTLFKVIAGILRPSAGTVRVSGSNPDRHVCIAYIEQHANINARFPATVEDVVAMGRIARVRYFRYPGRRDRAIVADAMERVDEPYAGLDAEASHQLTETLDAVAESMAVMVATHDLGVAEHLGRVMLLNRRLIAAGAPEEVLVAEHLAATYGTDLRRMDARAAYPLPDSHCDQAIHAGAPQQSHHQR